MKYLKIEASKGHFCIAPGIETPEWKTIDTIDKDDLMKLLEAAISEEFEMDPYVEVQLPNKAHQIIYKRLYEKLAELAGKKDSFNDEIESIYKAALEKYAVASEAPINEVKAKPEDSNVPEEKDMPEDFKPPEEELEMKPVAVAAIAKDSEKASR